MYLFRLKAQKTPAIDLFEKVILERLLVIEKAIALGPVLSYSSSCD